MVRVICDVVLLVGVCLMWRVLFLNLCYLCRGLVIPMMGVTGDAVVLVRGIYDGMGVACAGGISMLGVIRDCLLFMMLYLWCCVC